MKFLFKREWQELNDKGLEKLSKSMLTFFVLYTVLFFSMFFSVPLGLAP